MNRIRIDRLRVRRERPWLEVLPIEPPDPNVARAKALARAQQAGISSSSGPLPGIYTRLASSLGEWVASPLRSGWMAARHGGSGPGARSGTRNSKVMTGRSRRPGYRTAKDRRSNHDWAN